MFRYRQSSLGPNLEFTLNWKGCPGRSGDNVSDRLGWNRKAPRGGTSIRIDDISLGVFIDDVDEHASVL